MSHKIQHAYEIGIYVLKCPDQITSTETILLSVESTFIHLVSMVFPIYASAIQVPKKVLDAKGSSVV